jgi:PKD repeat protein
MPVGSIPKIGIVPRSNWIVPNPIEFTIGGNIEVVRGIDLTITRAVEIGLPLQSTEGQQLTALALTASDDGVFDWSVTGGPAEVGASNKSDFSFKPLNEGDYTVTLKYELDRESYTLERIISITSVAPIAEAGDDVSMSEGRFLVTREVIVDPGTDTWTVLVQYGNGEEIKFVDVTDRDISFDTIYSDPGTYTVDVTVSNTEGVSTDSFEVVVTQGSPVLDLIVEPFIENEIRQGVATPAFWEAVDPSFVADRFTWDYVIDWGDGTPREDVSDSLELDAQANRLIVRGEPTHVFQQEGTYKAALLVTDDHGVTYERTHTFTVVNDVPVAEISGDETVAEDELVEFTVNVIDLDGVDNVTWNFGDGTAQVSGSETTVLHSFAEPGEYKIIASVDDGDGGVTEDSFTITVGNIAEAPSIAAIPRLRVTEDQTLTFTVAASDPDPDAVLSFSAVDAPAGFDIASTTGIFTWTPALDQGSANYDFTIVVTDNTGRTAETPISIDVTDTGSIVGQLFQDIDVNGLFGITDIPISGIQVELDVDDDGTVDETALSDDLGNFEFMSLPHGLYRVTANLPSGFSSTTPTTLLVDMDTAEDVQLTAIGGSDDTDGDGVSNDDEINSPAGIDGNGDGIADWLQSNVVSAESPDAGPITLVGPAGTTVRNVQFGAPRTAPPSGGAFPYGAIRLEIEGLASGGKANVDLLLHENPSISVAFTYGQTTSNPFDELYRSIGHSVDGDRVTVQPHDGSRNDLDGVADGRVTEEFLLSDANLAWQNPANRFDVNNSGGVSANDALTIINRLRDRNPILPPVNDEIDRFYDVNGDGRVTAADALQIINELARIGAQSNNEQIDRPAASDRAIAAMMSDDDDKETDDDMYAEESRIF